VLRAAINSAGHGAHRIVIHRDRSASTILPTAIAGQQGRRPNLNLIQSRQAADPAERIVSVGDYNAFQFNDGYVDSIGTIKGTPTPANQVVLASGDLVNPDLMDLVNAVPASERYSFSFDGNAQELDHVLVTTGPQNRLTATDLQYGRMDADFPEAYRNDPNRPERLSDHDPLSRILARRPARRTTAVANPSTMVATATRRCAVVTRGHRRPSPAKMIDAICQTSRPTTASRQLRSTGPARNRERMVRRAERFSRIPETAACIASSSRRPMAFQAVCSVR
jgi:hypothetical protein